MERTCEDTQDGRQGHTSLSTDAMDHSSLGEFYEDGLQINDIKVLDEVPIVYTTKLDDMIIFKRSCDNLDYNLNDIANCILRESKPALKKNSIHSSHTDQTSYDRVVERIQVFNEKSRCKIINCDDGYISLSHENQINDKLNNLSEHQRNSNNNGYNPIENNTVEKLKSVIETTIDEVFNDIPVHTITSDTENLTPTPIFEIKSDEDDDVQILNYDLPHSKPLRLDISNYSNQSIKKRKKKSNINTTVTIDSTDSDEEEPLAMIKYKKQKIENLQLCKQLSILVEDIGLKRRQLRVKPFKGAGFLYCNKWYKIYELSTALKLMIKNVHIFFHDEYMQLIDIYIIEDGCMTEYKKVNFNTSSVILKNSFNLTDTIEIECYCWYEIVQATLKALESGILSTNDIMFMKRPHSCKHNRCVCCCSMQKNKKKGSTAEDDNKVSQDSFEIINLEEEISQKISTICNNDDNYCFVLRHNDWKHSLKRENNTPSLINECLSYNRGIDDKNVRYKYPDRMNSKKYTINCNKQKKLLQLKPFAQYILNCQETSSQRVSNVNVEPQKTRSFITDKLSLKPERATTTVAQFKTKAGKPDEFDIPEKSVEASNNTKCAVLWPKKSNNKKFEMLSVNAESDLHAETLKVKNIGEIINSCIHKYIDASFAKIELEPCAGNATEIERNKEFVSLETNHSNFTVSGNTSCENCDKDVDYLSDTILKKFQGLRLTVNEDRKVSVLLGIPLNTLSLYELKAVANIILKAQQQVDALALLPGTFLTKLSYTDNTLGKNHFQSSSHQVSNDQISSGQQKINELVELPKNNLANLHCTDNNTLGQITEHHQSSINNPGIMNKAISSYPEDTGMPNNVDGDFGNVYKKFSMILKIKNDSYKRSFLEFNPLRISNIYSLALDSATDSSSNKAKTSNSNENRNNAFKLLSENRQADSNCRTRRPSVKVKDVSAQCNTGKKQLNVLNRSPSENFNKQSFISPYVKVANYETISIDLLEPQRTPFADIEELDKIKQVDKALISHEVLIGNKTVELLPTPPFSDDAVGGMTDDSLKNSCYNNTNSQLKAQLNAKFKLPPIPFFKDIRIIGEEEKDPLADTSELLKLNKLKDKCSEKGRNERDDSKNITLQDLDSDCNVGADLLLNEEIDVGEEIKVIDFVSCGNEDWAIVNEEEETSSKKNGEDNFNNGNYNKDIVDEEIEGEGQNILGV